VSISVPDRWAVGDESVPDPRVDLVSFREEFYRCLPTRGDALFELTDALLCSGTAVRTLVELSLAAEHRRGHGALYDAINCGRVDFARLRRTLGGLTIPCDRDGRIVLAVDVSAWLRPDAPTSPQRGFCHVYGRGKNQAQLIPGWPYSFVAALETGRASWTSVLDAVRLRPDDDETAVTATQVREVITRLREAGHHRDRDPDILLVFDAGYELARLAFVLADLPVQVLGRMRSDRVLCFPAPPPARTGRPPRHGPEFRFADPITWPAPETTSSTETDRYGTASASAWNRLHPRLVHRGSGAQHPGPPPIVEGTVIRLTVDHLPGDRHPTPGWLWCSDPGVSADDLDRLWQLFLRRFFSRAHLPFLQADVGVDRTSALQSRGSRPLDLDRAGGLRPTPARPSPGRGPTPPVGTARPTNTIHAGTGWSRVFAHPCDDACFGQCTETQSTRTRTPTRIGKHPPRNAPPRGQTRRNQS